MSLVVEVESGAMAGVSRVAGAHDRPVSSFHGVPYAAAPTGDLRFRAPQPPAPWFGVRDATTPGPVPLQALDGPFAGLVPGSSAAAASEDCLTLEIWAPAEGGDHPVLVWLPGGAFVSGGASLATYDGSALASDHGVVVVGVNYRLGALGFAWLAGLEGSFDTNCGLRDQLAALEWVHRNIGAFGGDPANVTVVGESAGAGSLLHLLASTATRPLRRGILQSPGVDHTLRDDQGEQVTATFLRHLGERSLDIAGLQAVPAAAVLDAQEKTVLELMAVVGAMPFHPVLDQDLLPVTPSVAFEQGAAADVELIVSWTADEMRLFPNPGADAAGVDGIVQATRALLRRRIGAEPDDHRVRDLVRFYVDGLPGSTPAGWWSAILTDGVMRLPARRIADRHARSGGTTYVAEFAWRGPAPDGPWDPGAFHAIDLPFTFGTLDGCGWREFLRAGPDADRVCRAHMEAWTSFAARGRPVATELPDWPAYGLPARPTMVFDTPGALRDDPLAAVAEVWQGLWTADGRAPTL